MKLRILVVEDDKAIQKFIAMTLELNGYHVDTAESGRAARHQIAANNPDIIILDLGLPDMDGVSIISEVRVSMSTPIVVVSARSDMLDKISALDAGADDYLIKPFDTAELLARLRVALRRGAVRDGSVPVYRNRTLEIDYENGVVRVNGHDVHVTPIEYKLIVFLSRNTDKVLTYNSILKEVWGLYSDNIPALRVYVTTLRKKLETYDHDNQFIQTHVGVGYRMISL